MAEGGGQNRAASFYRRDHEHEYARDRGPPMRQGTYDHYAYEDRRGSDNMNRDRRFSNTWRRSASPERPDNRPARQRSPVRNGYGSRARSSSRPGERTHPHQQNSRDTPMSISTSFATNVAKAPASAPTGPSSKSPAAPTGPSTHLTGPSTLTHKSDKMPLGVDPSRDPRLQARRMSTNLPQIGNLGDSPSSPQVASPQFNNTPTERTGANPHSLPLKPSLKPVQSEKPTNPSTAAQKHARASASRNATIGSRETSASNGSTHAPIPSTTLALLNGMLDNASKFGALRMEKHKIESKTHTQERVEKKWGSTGKTFPAFVEKSVLSQQGTQQALVKCNEKLAYHRKKQSDLVSGFCNKSEAQTSMVKRCATATELNKNALAKLIDQVGENDKVLVKIQADLEKVSPGAAEVESLRLQLQPLTERVVKTEERLGEREDAAQKMKDHVKFSLETVHSKRRALETEVRESEANRVKKDETAVNAQKGNDSLRETTGQLQTQLADVKKITDRVRPALEALAQHPEDFKFFQKGLLHQFKTENQKQQKDISGLQSDISRLDGKMEASKKLPDRASTAGVVGHVNGTQPGLEEPLRATLLAEMQNKFDNKQADEEKRDDLIMSRMDELAQLITDRDNKDKKHEEDMTVLRKEYTDEVARRKAVEADNTTIASALARFVDTIYRTGQITEPQPQGDHSPVSNVQTSLGQLEKVITVQNRSWASSPLSAPPTPQLPQGPLPTNQAASPQSTAHHQVQHQGHVQVHAPVPTHPQAHMPAHLRGGFGLVESQPHGQGQAQGRGLPRASSRETARRFEMVEESIRVLEETSRTQGQSLGNQDQSIRAAVHSVRALEQSSRTQEQSLLRYEQSLQRQKQSAQTQERSVRIVEQSIRTQEQKIDEQAKSIQAHGRRMQAQDQSIQAAEQSVRAVERSLGTQEQTIRRHEETIQAQAGNYHTTIAATQALETRFNSLTTENVVQAMARQFNDMYPFALTAQQDIAKLYQEAGQLRQLIPDVERLKAIPPAVQHIQQELLKCANSNNAQCAKLGDRLQKVEAGEAVGGANTNNADLTNLDDRVKLLEDENLDGRVKQLEDEKNVHDVKYKALKEGVSKARENLNTQISEHGGRLDRGEERLVKLEDARKGDSSRMEEITEKMTEEITENVTGKVTEKITQHMDKKITEHFTAQDPDKPRRKMLEDFQQGTKRSRPTDSPNDSEATSTSSAPLASKQSRNAVKNGEVSRASPSSFFTAAAPIKFSSSTPAKAPSTGLPVKAPPTGLPVKPPSTGPPVKPPSSVPGKSTSSSYLQVQKGTATHKENPSPKKRKIHKRATHEDSGDGLWGSPSRKKK